MRCEKCGCTLFSCQCPDGATNRLLEEQRTADVLDANPAALECIAADVQNENGVASENISAGQRAYLDSFVAAVDLGLRLGMERGSE